MKRIIRSVPWEIVCLVSDYLDPIVCLVSDYLDPKTLAVASCVNKSWKNLMSSEFLWERICDRYYPSLLKLHRSSDIDTDNATDFSHRSLYAVALAASKRNPPIPLKPRLSLNDLVFAIDIHNNNNNSKSFSILKPCSELIKANSNGLFQFQFNIDQEDLVDFDSGDVNALTSVTWNVLKKGDWQRIFTVIDGAAQQRNSKTFSKYALATACCACCTNNPESGIVAEIQLELARQKITVGLINRLMSWRYLTLDEALRYLQCFILA